MVIAVACTTRPDKVIGSPPKGGPAASVLLLVDRWHAGVVIKISDIPGDLVPERRDFPVNTCNTWTAGALQAAGYSISSAITVGALVSDARRFGHMF
jgi:hypothetical protein